MNQASSSSSMPKPSIVLPVIAIIAFFFWPLGLILSIVAIAKYSKAKGTTARTLAIVALVMNAGLAVPLVGCLAAIAIPNFIKFQCRSKQSEARANLKSLYVSQAAHRAETDSYGADLNTIKFEPMGAKLRYTYRIVEATKDTFRAEATGSGDMEGDRWVITEKNALESLDSRCH